MATGDAYYDCSTIPVELSTLLKSLFLVDGRTGKVYVNVRRYDPGTCLESAMQCGTWDELASLVQSAIEIDACGLPALRLVDDVTPE